MRYRKLGRTGLQVSEIGLGTWALGGDEYGIVDDRESIRTIQAAVEEGVNFIDTADVYGLGHAETLIREALRGEPGKVVISTKAGNDIYSEPKVPGGAGKNFSPDYLVRATEGSLKRLGVEALDILMLHNPSMQVILSGEAFETLERLKEQGKIRFHGVSIYTPEEGLEAIRVGNPHVLMITFNLIAQEPRLELFKAAEEKGVGILIRTPLAEGLLTGKYSRESEFPEGDHRRERGSKWLAEGIRKQEALRFLERPDRSLAQAAIAFILSHPQVSSAVPGAKTRTQLEQNLAAARHAPIEAEELVRIYQLYDNDFRP